MMLCWTILFGCSYLRRWSQGGCTHTASRSAGRRVTLKMRSGCAPASTAPTATMCPASSTHAHAQTSCFTHALVLRAGLSGLPIVRPTPTTTMNNISHFEENTLIQSSAAGINIDELVRWGMVNGASSRNSMVWWPYLGTIGISMDESRVIESMSLNVKSNP